MYSKSKLLVVTGLMLALCSTSLFAQQSAAAEQGEYLVSIYHVAPGKHLDFLNWMATQETIAKEAGAPAAQWFAHIDGDNWDYIVISKQLDGDRAKEVDSKIEALTKQKGLPTGLAGSLKFRQFMASHTDTFVMGPFTAAEMVKAAEE